MSQAGYTPIQLYYSTTAAATPSAGNLANGELAINITDGKLFYKDNGGVVQTLASKGSGTIGGSNTQVQYNNNGALAGSANFTFDGSQISVYGVTVGRGAGGVATNTAVGASALADGSLTGASNTAIGFNALIVSTGAATQNTAMGSRAMLTNTTGGYNTAIGANAMRLNTTGAYNTSLGNSALYSNTTASYNTAVGYEVGRSNTTGAYNTWVGGLEFNNGQATGRNNTTGNYNVALGGGALSQNTTASNNTAVGYQSLYASTATELTALGYRAGYTATTGVRNTLIGSNAGDLGTFTGAGNIGIGAYVLRNNSSGTANTAVGSNDNSTNGALNSNTTGSYNVAIGTSALAANTTASSNTAVGYQAGYSNTTGQTNDAFGYAALYSNTTGVFNVGIGAVSLYSTTTGGYNTAVGREALRFNTTGANNTAVGYQTAYSTTTGYSNTIVGYQAGYSNTTGFQNTFIGRDSGYAVTTGSRNTIIGVYSGNQGNLDIRTSNGNVILSDGDGTPLLGFASNTGHFVNAASGATYTQLTWLNAFSTKAAIWWDNSLLRLQTYSGTTNGPYLAQNGTSWTNSSDERLKNITGEIQNGLNKVCSLRAAEYTWKSDETAKPQVGLIAQDVLAVLPQAVEVPGEGATEKDGSPAMMGVQYNSIIPLLVAAIKELKTELDAAKAEIATLKGN
jgi:hypothetical protein